MLNHLNVAEDTTDLVPCVLKAVQMMEMLRSAEGGLRVEDFRERTGYPRGTIYRILRTLEECDYVIPDDEEFYRLNNTIVTSAHGEARPPERDQVNDSWQTSDPSGFERWGVRFRTDGSRV